MAIRTEETEVREILLEHYNQLTQPSLYPFIRTAALLVDQVEECAARKMILVSAARLREIEAWLAGHFYEHADQMMSSSSTAGASGSFQGQTAMYLNSTKYGQTAMLLDTSGCLADIVATQDPSGGGRRVASIRWAGKTRSQQLDYEQRN